MASTFSNLKFELIGTGDQSGTWGTTTNTNLGTAIEQALVGMATISSGFVTNSLTLTLTDTNAAQNARALVLNLTQALSGAGTLNVPAIQKPYMIINATGQTVTVKVTGLTGVAVPTGTRAFLYNNGTDVGDFFNYASSLTLGTALPITSGGTGTTSTTFVNLTTNVTGTLPIANGGTGTTSTTFANLATNVTGTLPIANGGTAASTAPNARTNLGATTVGSNFFTLTNPSAITFPRMNADNTVSALDAATFRTAIGAGTGAGTVTSVSWTGGIVSVATETTTPAFTIAGTSGGIPYFSSASTWASSAALAANAIVIGGGAGVAPATTTTGTGVVTAIGNNTNAASGLAVLNASGNLNVAQGGTGAGTFTANNVLLGNGTSAFQVVAPGTSGNVLTSNGTTWSSTAPAVSLSAAQTFTALQTFSGSTSVAAVKLANAEEVATISATAATGTINYDITTQSVLYYTSNASANWTVNFRGSSGTSLNTLMSTGESMTVAFLVTQGSTAYYNSAVQVDGSSVTPKWQGGTAPSAGNASSIDSYVYTIIKTGAATFTVLASQTKFA